MRLILSLAWWACLAAIPVAHVPAAGASAVEPSPPASGDSNRLEYVLVITGGELLQGSVQDSHTGFIARSLRPLGAVCVGSHIVDDLDDDLRHAVEAAVRRAPLVLVTGGLGPTANDITRDTLAATTGIPLHEAPAIVEELASRLRTTADNVPGNLRRQARVPTRGGHLDNANGTAVGLIFDAQPSVVVALPGPPRELQPMVRDALVPWMRSRFGLHAVGCSLTLRFVGVGQSRIDQVLRERVRLPAGVVVGSVFDGSRVDFTFTLSQDDEDSRAQLGEIESAVRRELGANLYGTGTRTLEEQAMAGIRTNGQKLVLAEVGSGGALAAALLRDPSTRPLLAGAFSAPTGDRLQVLLGVSAGSWAGARSEDARVRLLAEHAQQRADAAWAIAVGEPWSGAGGSLRVWVVAGGPGGRWEKRELELRDSAESGRASLVNEVLDWVRRL